MKSLTLTRGVALSAALWLFDVAPALAAGGENTPLHLGSSARGHASSGTGASIVRTIIGLLVVIAVIYGISWILRQYKTSRSKPTGTGLESVASLPLGNNRAVTLIRVGHELVLLGVSEQSITRISTYTEQEALAQGLLDEPALAVLDDSEFRELPAGPPLGLPESVAGRLGLTRPAAPRPALPRRTGTSSQPTLGRLVETLRSMTVRS